MGAAGPPTRGVGVSARNHWAVAGRKTPTRSEPLPCDQPQAPTRPWSPGVPNGTEVAGSTDVLPGVAKWNGEVPVRYAPSVVPYPSTEYTKPRSSGTPNDRTPMSDCPSIPGTRSKKV